MGKLRQARYFGVNSLKFTNAKGPPPISAIWPCRAGESYLTTEARKAQSPNYLQDEIKTRAARQPIVFDWYAQIAAKGDAVEDPAIAWPDSRKLVKLGTFTLTAVLSDSDTDRSLLFLPGQPHPGVPPVDPMLVLRISPIQYRWGSGSSYGRSAASWKGGFRSRWVRHGTSRSHDSSIFLTV